jgi:hypothetical protein
MTEDELDLVKVIITIVVVAMGIFIGWLILQKVGLIP